MRLIQNSCKLGSTSSNTAFSQVSCSHVGLNSQRPGGPVNPGMNFTLLLQQGDGRSQSFSTNAKEKGVKEKDQQQEVFAYLNRVQLVVTMV